MGITIPNSGVVELNPLPMTDPRLGGGAGQLNWCEQLDIETDPGRLRANGGERDCWYFPSRHPWARR